MTTNRRGLGAGRGSGYRNILPKDPRVHNDSRLGRKQPQRIVSPFFHPLLGKGNNIILQKREAMFNKSKGARIGDFLLYKGEYVRFSHDWGDSFQTSVGGHFYLGDGYVSMSNGSLEHGLDKSELIDTGKKKLGGVWFFDRDIAGAGMGRDFQIKFRVFKVKDESKLRDYDILGKEMGDTQ